MHELAVGFRALQFGAHNCHNLVSGPTFFADHEFLGELYGAYEAAYDSVVERMIGLGQKPDLNRILLDAAERAAQVDAATLSPDAMFKVLLVGENSIQRLVAGYVDAGVSDGTENLLQQLADDSEVRCYKMKQRTAK